MAEIMQFPGLIFLTLTICTPLWFAAYRLSRNLTLMFAACIIHIAAVFLQYRMLANANADAHIYYYGLEGYLAQPISLGTAFLVHATFWLRSTFDISFIDMMLLFGMIGNVSILLLMAQVEERVPEGVRLLPYFACMIPGLFFWTSLIGKDALTTTSVALLMVSAWDLPRRKVGFGLGLLLMVLIRPHMALLLGAAFGLSRLFFSEYMTNRLAIIVLSALGLPIAVIAIQNFVGVNLLDLTEVSQFFSERQAYVSSSADQGVVFISNPVSRVIYFLFRPMFFDAEGLLGMFASVENFAIVSVIARCGYLWRKYGVVDRKNATFFALSALAVMLLLGLTGYNVGLALRQKVMAYPALISLLALCEASAALRRQERTPTSTAYAR